MKIEQEFNSVQPPYSLSRRDLSDEISVGLRNETLSLGALELERLHKINEVLQHPALDTMIEEGNLTLGIIKPHAHEGRDLPDRDQEAADKLIDEVGRDNIVFSFSSRLNNEQAVRFYSDVKPIYEKIQAGPDKTVWDTISEFAQSGPLTFLLIYRSEGDAVSWWRNRMGKTRANEADPNSIRGKYAIQDKLPNNLTHGSDSVDSVKKEIGFLRGLTQELESKAALTASSMPSDETLRDLGIVGDKQEVLSIQRIFDSGMRSESWIYGYKVAVLDPTNTSVQYVYIKEKNMISFAGGLGQKASIHNRRMEEIKSIGIPVPQNYGVRGATHYQEFIVNDHSERVINSIASNPLSDDIIRTYLDQLLFIAKRLDASGYQTINFIADLVFDVDNQGFKYVDFGSDIGDKTEHPTTSARDTLLQKFPMHRQYILTH